MKRIIPIFLFLFFIVVLDRFFFLPERMNGTWEFRSGKFMGDSITFNNIDIVNNYEIKISANRDFDSFYLIGCYFGRLYLLDKDTLQFTQYVQQKGIATTD